MICPTTRTARDVRLALDRSGVETELLLGDELAIYRTEVPPRLAGRTLAELQRPGELAPLALERAGHTLMAAPELTVAYGDVLHVLARWRDDVADMARPQMRILVCGAGATGMHVARVLSEVYPVTMIESAPERLPADQGGFSVMLGDAADAGVLARAAAADTDVLIAATGHDPANLVIARVRRRRQDGHVPSDSPVVTLSDGLVTLRPWSRDDARFMAEASADPAIRRYNGSHDRLGRPAPPPSTTDAEAVIDQFALSWRAFAATGTPSGVVFAILDERSGELVGCCGVDDWSQEDVAQFGYWIAPNARGRGYATRAAILLTRWLFDLGAARVFLTIVAGNEESVAVARRAGFVYEGTMRDHGVWQGQRCDVMLFAALPLEWAVGQAG